MRCEIRFGQIVPCSIGLCYPIYYTRRYCILLCHTTGILIHMQYYTILYPTLRFSILFPTLHQYYTILCNIIFLLYNTTQYYATIQYHTIQHEQILHYIVLCNEVRLRLAIFFSKRRLYVCDAEDRTGHSTDSNYGSFTILN